MAGNTHRRRRHARDDPLYKPADYSFTPLKHKTADRIVRARTLAEKVAEVESRASLVSSSGWASPRSQPYQALGDPVLDAAALKAMVQAQSIPGLTERRTRLTRGKSRLVGRKSASGKSPDSDTDGSDSDSSEMGQNAQQGGGHGPGGKMSHLLFLSPMFQRGPATGPQNTGYAMIQGRLTSSRKRVEVVKSGGSLLGSPLISGPPPRPPSQGGLSDGASSTGTVFGTSSRHNSVTERKLDPSKSIWQELAPPSPPSNAPSPRASIVTITSSSLGPITTSRRASSATRISRPSTRGSSRSSSRGSTAPNPPQEVWDALPIDSPALPASEASRRIAERYGRSPEALARANGALTAEDAKDIWSGVDPVVSEMTAFGIIDAIDPTLRGVPRETIAGLAAQNMSRPRSSGSTSRPSSSARPRSSASARAAKKQSDARTASKLKQQARATSYPSTRRGSQQPSSGKAQGGDGKGSGNTSNVSSGPVVPASHLVRHREDPTAVLEDFGAILEAQRAADAAAATTPNHQIMGELLRMHSGTELDPAHQLELARVDFLQTKAELGSKLVSALDRLDSEREDTYYRKFTALNIKAVSNGEELKTMRLESERLRLVALMDQHDRHLWYIQLLAAVTDGNREVSNTERFIINNIRMLLEAGRDFTADHFWILLDNLKPNQHKSPDVQRILTFLREQVLQIPPQAYRDWLVARSILVPPSLQAQLTAAKKRAAAAAAATPLKALRFGSMAGFSRSGSVASAMLSTGTNGSGGSSLPPLQ